MSVVMQLVGDAYLRPLAQTGQYLKAMDFEAHGGQGEIIMTPLAASAMQFATVMEAIEFTRTVPKCRATRADGKPNRPLTSTTWEYVTR